MHLVMLHDKQLIIEATQNTEERAATYNTI